MKKLHNYQATIYVCFASYIVQAIVNNFAPLLFLTFSSQFGIPLSKITLLITFNFALQLVVDLMSAFFVDQIGMKACAVLANILSAAGLILLAVLPHLFSDAFIGILLAVIVYACGGGLLEVVVSPIVESCPGGNKEAAMSLLHSFYCWGQVGVIALSTLFFATIGIQHWPVMSLLWGLFPVVTALLFTQVPVRSIQESTGRQSVGMKTLLTNKTFLLFFVMMLCAGASEQAVSQWASTFAEKGLGVAKTIGDLAGPMSFAFLMGTSRAIYGKHGPEMNLKNYMLFSSLLCIGGYLLVSFSPLPALSLAGIGICGFAAGIMWPGTFSLSSAALPEGGTAMFSFLALAGDVGCSLGPTITGMVSSANNGSLQSGLAAAMIFPILMTIGILYLRKTKNK